jgi:predicted GNAT family acetyltransferase
MTEKNENLEVRHNTDEDRFEVQVENQIAVLNYTERGNTITFTHTGVPSALEGRGIGSKLAHAGLEYAREKGYRVMPSCWFVAGYIERHPEYQDLLGKGK